jgi:hypothetical protein
MGWVRVAAALLLALVLTGAAPGTASTGQSRPIVELPRPRELSEAERAAVELATAYFQGGPEAWWDSLAAGAPLRRLGRAAALEEIGVRAGPVDGVTWQLLTPGPKLEPQTAVFGIEFASGLDETLVLHLVDEGGWKIAGLRAGVDPIASFAPRSATLPVKGPASRRAGSSVPAAPAGNPASNPESNPAGSPTAWRIALALFTLSLIGAAGTLLLARAGKRRPAFGAGAATVVAGAGVGLWIWMATPSPAAPPAARPAPKPAVESGVLRLGSLLPLRRALAEGTDRAEIERRLATPPADPALREIQELWRAQYLLLESDLTAADAALGRAPSAKAPLADLLHARLAFRRLQREPTRAFYDAAIDHGLDVDALHMEAALAKSLTDQDDLAQGEIASLTGMGSRLSEPWYSAARRSAAEDRMEESEDLLLRAWQLEPAPRAELFDDPVFAFLVTRPKLFPLFRFGDPEEPRPAPAKPRRSLPLPLGARVATCGEALHLALGSAELSVPGGAELAPEGTPIEDAQTWSRHAEEKALADLPSLNHGMAPGETLQPRRLRVAQVAGRALAEQNRWSDLLALTEPLAADIEHAPALLVRLRAQALRQLDRKEEARQLLIHLARSDFAGRRPTAGTLLDLSELFAAAGEYDTAIRLSEKADHQLPRPRGERRRKQLALDRDLAASYASFHSEHFEVRYPKATGEQYARGVTIMLEKERERLAHWIPGAGAKPVEVYLFPLQDFFDNFGGDMGVVGLFDGKVRVPFAELRSLHPKLVSILSHELAHAMIAAATHDQAPHWFQEGMAEHVEMGRGRLNPMPDLARTGRVLSFPTLDPILRGFAEEQLIDLAYSEAAWSINFVEERFGTAAIHRLIAAYAKGETTDQALKQACGLTPAEFDHAFWQWGTTQAPQSRDVDVRRYDVEYRAQVNKEHKNEVGSILRVGATENANSVAVRQKEAADEQRRKMAAWHAAYTAGTAQVKLSVKSIIQRYRAGAGIDVVPACTELSTDVPRLLENPALWASPDPDVKAALRNAYQTLGNLGTACLAGRENEIRFLIVEAERALAEAARVLEPYGLTP